MLETGLAEVDICGAAHDKFSVIYQSTVMTKPHEVTGVFGAFCINLLPAGKRFDTLARSAVRGHRLALDSHAFQKKGIAMKVRVSVSLKNGVLDPQGRAIHHSLEGLGFSGVKDVRAGRLIELEVEDDVSDADLDEMCKKLLANMVIENYRIERVAA